VAQVTSTVEYGALMPDPAGCQRPFSSGVRPSAYALRTLSLRPDSGSTIVMPAKLPRRIGARKGLCKWQETGEAWKERRDGHWVSPVPMGHGHYELSPEKGGGWHAWKMEPERTPLDLGSSSTLGGAMMAAKRDAEGGRQAAEHGDGCGCPHAHPPEVPTVPCGETTGKLRWRVVAVQSGRHGKPLRWQARSGHRLFTIHRLSSGRYAVSASHEKPLTHKMERLGEASSLEQAKRLAVDHEASYHEPSTARDSAPYERNTRDPKAVEAGRKLGVVDSPAKIYEALRDRLSKESQEVFLVIPLDLRGQPLCPPVEVARGQRDQVEIDPSDVYRPVIQHNAKGFVVVHCHPSGHAKPSPADKHLTASLEKGTPVAFGHKGGKFLDHVIIASSATRGEYASYRDHWRIRASRH